MMAGRTISLSGVKHVSQKHLPAKETLDFQPFQVCDPRHRQLSRKGVWYSAGRPGRSLFCGKRLGTGSLRFAPFVSAGFSSTSDRLWTWGKASRPTWNASSKLKRTQANRTESGTRMANGSRTCCGPGMSAFTPLTFEVACVFSLVLAC